MEKDDLRQLASKAQLEPFRIRMTGGESFDVRHPDYISVSDYHAAIVVPDSASGRERLHLATLVNISTVEMLPAEIEKGSNGKASNG